MKNLEVCIQITIKPTEARVASDQGAIQVDEGHFRVVLDGGSRFDIDALEEGVLEVGFPAMREALVGALEEASREQATEVGGEKGGPAAWSGTPMSTGSMAK
jgi:hypothetical protein